MMTVPPPLQTTTYQCHITRNNQNGLKPNEHDRVHKRRARNWQEARCSFIFIYLFSFYIIHRHGNTTRREETSSSCQLPFSMPQGGYLPFLSHREHLRCGQEGTSFRFLLVVSDPAPLVRPYLVCLLPV